MGKYLVLFPIIMLSIVWRNINDYGGENNMKESEIMGMYPLREFIRMPVGTVATFLMAFDDLKDFQVRLQSYATKANARLKQESAVVVYANGQTKKLVVAEILKQGDELKKAGRKPKND